jgi:hypothetical protein
MESRIEKYRLRAAQCLQASKDVANDTLKSLYLDMAKQWLDLARSAEFAQNEPAKIQDSPENAGAPIEL